jgi:hypothetical protein
MNSCCLQKPQIRSPIHDEKNFRSHGRQDLSFAPGFAIPSRLNSVKTAVGVRPSVAAIVSIGVFGTEK